MPLKKQPSIHRSLMKRIYCLLFVLLVTSCAKKKTDIGTTGNNGSTPAGKLNEYIINPSATNPNILTYDNPHYVYLDTRISPKNLLFVFLPGTSGFPSVYTLIAKKAASLGYHAIGLMYPNGSEMYMASGSNPDNTSFGRCRQEIFDGSDQSLAISINAENCITGRLNKLLQYLNANYPTQHWGQFLVNGQIDWSKCVVAGHSQGGGHALYIAKKISVSKAISFASIDWNTYLGASASWIFDPGATPVSKLYSINSTNDQVFSYTNMQIQLGQLGILGNPVSIDNIASPYGGTHRLITSATPAISLLVPDHNITCLDQYIPNLPSGAVTTEFDNAWAYLLNN